MRLVHFSDQAKLLPYSVKQIYYDSKPSGLWVSDEDDYGWKNWCEGENFRLSHLKHAFEITLKPDAKIYYIRTATELDAFVKEYRVPAERSRMHTLLDDKSLAAGLLPETFDIDWPRLEEEGYQGIIITPYLYERRLARGHIWYYGWDCASGCIWNTEAIQTYNNILLT